MAPIVTRIKFFSGTCYAYIPPNIAQKYRLKDEQAVGVELTDLEIKPFDVPEDQGQPNSANTSKAARDDD